MPKRLRTTAAWRISIWTATAFAIGTAIAFSIVYLLVAKSVRQRGDAWLIGEADTLAQVAKNTPRDSLYDRIVEEVAELATQEIPEEPGDRGKHENSVFFLETDPQMHETPLWVGPNGKEAFLQAIQTARLTSGKPQSIHIQGWKQPFRVVAHVHDDGSAVYLGLSDRGARHLLHNLTRSFLAVWSGTFVLGCVISYFSARRTLLRVERITEAVARMGSENLKERLPESRNSDEIARLAETFNHMLDRIQSSVSQLRAVTDAVAHDLKSPVTSIRGTLESALCDGANERLQDSVGEAIEGLDRLLQRLNTTLDLAEAEAGALHLDRKALDLSEVARQLAEIYRPAMAEKNQRLVLDLESKVMIDADASLMERVVSNLLENELMHLPSNSEIFIRLRTEQGAAELTIQDNGPGFPFEIRERVFERFVKGKQSPGHGLGLAFVDAVVQVHGGSVKVGLAPSGGALITMALPIGVFQAA
jgi:signal transduction histidine kinase